MGLLEEKLSKHPFFSLAKDLKERSIYPYFREIEGKQGTEVEMGGHRVLMFGSNAYTGLTGDDRIIEAGCKAMRQYGSGCAGSRFLNGRKRCRKNDLDSHSDAHLLRRQR